MKSSRSQPRAKKKTGNGPLLRFDVRLPYRPPFDWSRMLNFFQFRAIPGVEFVAGGVYHRAIRIRDTFGLISVVHAASGHALLLTAALSDDRDLEPVIGRVRRMFDLDADMGAIHHVLGMDPVLKRVIGNQPGLRLPGAWDSFEVAVRAIVGQQISVKGPARSSAGLRSGPVPCLNRRPLCVWIVFSRPPGNWWLVTCIGSGCLKNGRRQSNCWPKQWLVKRFVLK